MGSTWQPDQATAARLREAQGSTLGDRAWRLCSPSATIPSSNGARVTPRIG